MRSYTYLSHEWRELLAGQTATKQSSDSLVLTSVGEKRRFMALPLRLVFRRKRRIVRKSPRATKHPMSAVRGGILRRALRRRRLERVFVDLRHFVYNRRLPKDKTAASPRRQRRVIRRRPAAKQGQYSRQAVQKRLQKPIR